MIDHTPQKLHACVWGRDVHTRQTEKITQDKNRNSQRYGRIRQTFTNNLGSYRLDMNKLIEQT